MRSARLVHILIERLASKLRLRPSGKLVVQFNRIAPKLQPINTIYTMTINTIVYVIYHARPTILGPLLIF